eukprot:scaffold76325_cov75-Phaeocystis_antarctica.AAC.1
MCAHAVQQDRSRSSPAGTRRSIGSPHCSQNAGPVAEESTIEWRRTIVRVVRQPPPELVQAADASRASEALPSQSIASGGAFPGPGKVWEDIGGTWC